MKCPSCQAELAGAPRYCSECGADVKSPAPAGAPAAAEDALKAPSGFSRTLSTEIISRQMELRVLVKLGELIQSRTYRPGEVVIRKGETNRDLFILTEGLVEISRHEGDTEFVLNEIEPPYIIGEIAFLFGAPRTATATAKTEVKAFVLKYADLKELVKDFPAWLPPLLTTLASDMKSLHHKAKMAEKKLLELEGERKPRS